MRLTALALGLLTISGCASVTNSFTINRVLDRALKTNDVEMGCETGISMRNLLAAVPSEKHPPQAALVGAEGAAALCEDLISMDLELERKAFRANLLQINGDSLAYLTDMRLHEERVHERTARRWLKTYELVDDLYGPIGADECPRIKRRDELVYMFGLVAGVYAVIHDKASNGRVNVPLDIVAKVGRSTQCLDDATWWNAPSTLQAASWAFVPGSGPADIDPWERMETSATAGGDTGVRLAWAVLAKVASNAGEEEKVIAAIQGMKQSIDTTPSNAEFMLFDEFSRRIAQHESDLMWIEAKGHRTPAFGDLPPTEAPEDTDIFGDNPFGSDDPFGADISSEDENPDEESPAVEGADAVESADAESSTPG